MLKFSMLNRYEFWTPSDVAIFLLILPTQVVIIHLILKNRT